MVLHEAALLWHDTAALQRCCVTVLDPLLDRAGTAVFWQGSGSPVQQLEGKHCGSAAPLELLRRGTCRRPYAGVTEPAACKP